MEQKQTIKILQREKSQTLKQKQNTKQNKNQK